MPLRPSGKTSTSCSSSYSRRCTLAGCAGTPPILVTSIAEAGIALEEVLDREVQRARARVLLLDRLGDHRRVGRQRAGVVGDQQRAAGGRDVLDPLDLAAEPVVVEELVERRVEQALDALRAAPVGDLAVGLDRGQQRARVAPAGAGRARQSLMRRVPPAAGSRRRASVGQSAAHTMSSSSHSSRFHGCTSVAASIPPRPPRAGSPASRRSGRRCRSRSQRATLSKEQYSSS